MVNPDISAIVTTTLRQRAKQYADNVSNNNGLLTRLKTRGQIKELSGGRTIFKELRYTENNNFQYYTGYEVLDITPNQLLTAAEYDWKQAAVNVSMNGLEMRQNSGSEAVLDLLEGRIESSMDTMANNISIGVYSDGTGSGGKQIGGLQLLVADDPTTGTVGGINRANFSFWRNKKFDTTVDGSGAASATNIIGYMNSLYNQLVRGNDYPDLIVQDLNHFGFYQNALQSQQRYTGEGDLNKAGFQSLKYNNADVILENGSGIATNHTYMLNTKYIHMEAHKDANMTPGNQKDSVNQDAMVIPVLFQGNMTLSNAFLQGVLFDQ